MSDAVERVLAALRARMLTPRQRGSHWSCRCPAHEDRTPSLSIGIGRDGRALLTCHAGCSVQAVVAALGLSMRDLMGDAERRPELLARPASRYGWTYQRSAPQRADPVPPEPVDLPTEACEAPADEAATIDLASIDETPSPEPLIASFERRYGAASNRWTYHDERGEPVGIVVRWDMRDAAGASGKVVIPFSIVEGAWANRALPAPRPLYRLPELLRLPAGAWIYVCEGEKTVEAARSIGVVATTSAGGAKAAAQTDWSPVRDKVVVVLPDYDEPGEAYADEVAERCRQAGAEEIRVLRLWEHWPSLPKGGDLVDVLSLEGDDAPSLHERIDQLAASTPPHAPVEAAPRAVLRYEPFPVDLLPQPVRAYVVEGASAIGCDASFIALPLLSALAAAIGNTRRILLKRGWAEPAIVWTAIIGESGTQKSPAFRLALKAVRARQHRLLKEHQETLREWTEEMRRLELEAGDRKRNPSRSGGPAEPPEAPPRPVCPRTVIEDCTTEALSVLLQENPRGLLTLRGELSGWFSFGQYKNGGGGDDVARWLQMFDGDPLVVDRKSSGTTYVPCAAVSIAGGIQPTILERSIGQKHRDNGLLARLLLAHPPRRAKRWTEAEVSPATEAAVMRLFDRLYELEGEVDEHGDPVPRLLGIGSRAKAAWIAFVDEHGQAQLSLAGDEAAAWSKLEGYAARFALIVHLVRAAMSDPTLRSAELVDEASIAAGVQLSRWFAGEARRVYATLSADEEERALDRLITIVDTHRRPLTTRDWQRLRWLPTAAEAKAELEQLVAAGVGRWEQPQPGARGGRPSPRFVPVGSDAAVDETSPSSGPRGPQSAPRAAPEGVVSVLSMSTRG